MGSFPSEIAKELPGRHFNDRRGIPQTIQEWVKVKATNDQHTLGFRTEPSLWCIGNKLYDLSSFIPHHPGGESWLKQTKGMDITGYFITHHLNQPKVVQLLSKYYVKDLAQNAEDLHTFNWNKDCKYFKLQRQVHDHLVSKYGTHYNKHRWSLHVLSLMVLSLWCISFYAFCINPSLLGAIISGCLLHPFIGIGHNYFHQADHKGWFGMETYWRYMMNFTMYSFEDWRLSHAISHHLDINLSDDYECSSIEPIVYFMTASPTNSPLIYVYIHAFMFLLPGVNYIVKAAKLNHMIPLIQLGILIAVNMDSALSLWTLIGYWYVMHGTMGYILQAVATPVHRSDYCWTEGDVNGSKDFVHHILLSTMDYNTDYPTVLSLFLFEMFNDHRIHHLFPTLDLSLVKEIRPIVETFCKQNELGDYMEQKYGFMDLYVGLYRYYYRFKNKK
eukprot:79355_1